MAAGGAGWHKSQSMPIPNNIRLLSLPPCSPELNPAEHLWDGLREKCFQNRTLDSLEKLEDQLVKGLRDMQRDTQRVQSICNWQCIIDATSNAN